MWLLDAVKRALEDHFDTNFELEHQIAGSSKEAALDQIRELTEACTFSYTRQRAMRGLGDAVLTGRTLVGNEPFGLVLADDLCLNLAGDGVLKQMKALAKIHDCSVIAVMDVPDDQVSKYGIVVGEAVEENLLKVSSMVEKPAIEEAPSNLAVIGRYVLGPEIFAYRKYRIRCWGRDPAHRCPERISQEWQAAGLSFWSAL